MNVTSNVASVFSKPLEFLNRQLGRTRFTSGIANLFPECLLLATFFVISRWLFVSAALPPTEYEAPLVFFSYLAHLFSSKKLAAGMVAGVILLLLARARLNCKWRELAWGQPLRLLVGISLLAVAWPLITSEYNYYVDRSHAIDRLLVAALTVAVFYRPAFVFAFLAVSSPMIFEFDAPIGIYPWAFFGMPLHVLTLFAAWILLGMLTNRWNSETFVFLLFCLIAAHYWIPGVRKLFWGWLFDNDIYYFLPTTYANGWMAFLSPETIAAYANTLELFNMPMKFATLVLECGCLFMIACRRGGLLFFVAGYIVFHSAVFLISGILMWQWMMVEIVVLRLIWKRRIVAEPHFFSLGRRIGAVAIVALSPYWLQTAALSWYDSPVSYIYTFEAVEPSGARYSLGPRFFTPFDEQFSFSAFFYLTSERNLLKITWGATTKQIANDLKQARSPADVFAYESTMGQPTYDVEQVQVLRDFLVRYTTAYNRAPWRNSLLRYLTAPPGIVTLPRHNAIPMGRTISRIEVTEVVSWFDKQSCQVIRQTPVLAVNIPLAPAEE